MRSFLIVIVLLAALLSIATGILWTLYPYGNSTRLPVVLPEHTIFKNFKTPGILLLATVGYINGVALFRLLDKQNGCYNWAIAAGITACGWVLIQAIFINAFYWSDSILASLGIISIFTAVHLKGKWLV
ncbi:MAG: hypothetical protein ACTHLE_26990 [Agriterribacter sp.]